MISHREPCSSTCFDRSTAMLLRTVDVEKLVDDQHSVRSIWALVGRLELRLYHARIAAVEGGWRSFNSPRRFGWPTFAVLVLQRWDILLLGCPDFDSSSAFLLHPLFSRFSIFQPPAPADTRHPAANKPLKIIIDKLYQCAIMASLGRQDSSSYPP